MIYNSCIHTWVSKPFPIWIYSRTVLISVVRTVNNDFNADPFNLDQKAIGGAISIRV